MDKYTIIDTFCDKLDCKSLFELDRMLDQFQRKIELKTSKVISNEISKVIDQVQDEATLSREKPNDEFLLDNKSDQMTTEQAISLLKLAVPVRPLTNKEFEKFIIAVNMAMNSLEAFDKVIAEIEENNPDNYFSDKPVIITKKTVIETIEKYKKEIKE